MPGLKKWSLGALFLVASIGAGAQSSSGGVWQGGRNGVRQTKARAAKKVSALKAWKKHIEQWGLDSSYTHSLALFGRLNSDGWSGGIIYGRKQLKQRDPSYWQLSLSEVKHEKETKQQRTSTMFPELGSGTPYVYGKVNNLYLLQLGYGKEKVLLPAVLEGNVAIGFRYGGGLSLAMLKPYYLELIYPDYSTNPATAISEEEAYSKQDRERFLNTSLILGKGRWSKGLGEMRYVPGLYGEAALAIRPVKGKSFIQVITLGVNGSLYSKELTIMEANRAYPWRMCLFATLEIGKRWK